MLAIQIRADIEEPLCERKKKFQILNEGQTVSIPSGSYGTIRFGHFISGESIKRFKGTFKMDMVKSGNNGIGLITPKFTGFDLKTYNYGKNHSIIFYEQTGGIYLVPSEEFNLISNCIFFW